jgi:hypothetical protein
MRRPFLAGLLLALLVSAFGPAVGRGGGSYSLRGTVTSGGRAAACVWVVVQRDGQELGRALTADDGRYYVSRLEPGSYRVLVRRGPATVYNVPLTLTDNAVYDIVLGS